MTTPVQLKDLKPGDTVDVLLKNVRVRAGGAGPYIMFNDGAAFPLTVSWLTDATITRRDPPIEKGSTVVMHGVVYEVHATSSTYAWLLPLPDQNQPDLFVTAPISSLTVTKGPKS